MDGGALDVNNNEDGSCCLHTKGICFIFKDKFIVYQFMPEAIREVNHSGHTSIFQPAAANCL